MTVVVTGAAGFIGANIVKELNQRGCSDIVAVDDLSQPGKFANLADLRIADYFDKNDFLHRLAAGQLGRIEAVFHEGACSDTMEHDGQFMMANNYRWSKHLLDICLRDRIRLLYASSAAVYGASTEFAVDPANEHPLNVYGYSKLLFDNVVRRHLDADSPVQIAGFRYFNVYGPREACKGRMASVAWHHMQQLRDEAHVRLFGAYGGYAAGEQLRDFVSVRDIVRAKLWFFDNSHAAGIFNLGTGRAEPFNAVASAVINAERAASGQAPLTLAEQVAQGLIRYVDFPDALKGRYQCFTQADLSGLRAVGYDASFATVEEGVSAYARDASDAPVAEQTA
ncbi:ADP-glyceromanno-heptose 6-epimerase [Tsuneonella flava]|uniref:ADP-L-glycero-D-manno-heptose-6-epimerase n=1 Tax=Tsuneonella flava TaxID=2055955 RepID=A0ABX7K9P5_9SPHN|nr:ADP-glyceromanno-heptose 6-epimerase [Tsuneonella flava]QSB44975.1 ADP-glyceromanno-heptose 6-epimerase [Tsuneonella flava]